MRSVESRLGPAQSSLLSAEHSLPSTNATAAALLLAQLMLTWTSNLRTLRTADVEAIRLPDRLCKDEKRSKRTRTRLFRLEEYSSDELSFSGSMSSDDLPDGRGDLVIKPSSSSGGESCVKGVCQRDVVSVVNGTFVGGRLNGGAAVIFADGSLLLANFVDDAVHGFAVEFSPDSRVTSASFYDSGRRVGLGWQLEPLFGTAVFGPFDAKGKLSGDDVVLVHEAFALKGSFEDAVLADEAARPAKVTKVAFSDGGLIMIVEVEEDSQANKLTATDRPLYLFTPAANLHSTSERFLAQSAWLSMLRRDAVEPRPAIRNETLLAMAKADPEKVEYLPANSHVEGTGCENIASYTEFYEGTARGRWLACYPGSGSKWLLTSFAAATGLAVSGVISDHVPSDYRFDLAVLIKSHHQTSLKWSSPFNVLNNGYEKQWSRAPEDLPWRLQSISDVMGRAVVLVRNPYEAIISMWNHERQGSYDSYKAEGVRTLAEDVHTQAFKDFVKSELVLWEELYLDFISLGSEVLVMHYETMFEDVERTMTTLARHIGIDIDQKRLKCVVEYGIGAYKRKKKAELSDPFSPELVDRIEKAIDNVQSMIQLKGYTPMPLHKYKYRKGTP